MEARVATEDLEDLQERLRYVRSGDQGRLITIVGSGLSNSLLPSTDAMTDRFLDVLGPGGRRVFESRVAGDASSSERYQLAARMLARQRNERLVTRTIRQAIAEAFEGTFDPEDDASVRSAYEAGAWNIPSAHRRFADYYARLPASAQGAILTTNFDPFIELALREVGIEAEALSMPIDATMSATEVDSMDRVPVIHVHGFFTGAWALNSAEQLMHERPRLEALIESLLADSTVLVMGYGGWDDAIMRVLQAQVRHELAVNAEVVWAFHGSSANVQRNPKLAAMLGSPGFQLYSGIDAELLFDMGSAYLPSNRPVSVQPRGYTRLPLPDVPVRESSALGDVASPSWFDGLTDQWPEVTATRELGDQIASALAKGQSAMLAAIGPMGEGKTLALRQLAMRFAEANEDGTVLWREQGAPPLGPEFATELSESATATVIFLDDADRASSDVQVIESRPSGGAPVVLVLAAQDRLWWTLPRSITDRVDPVIFDGLSEDDALRIARRWKVLGVRSTLGPTASVEEVARALQVAAARAGTKRRSSLFGAILEVKESTGLAKRVDDLMNALSVQTVRRTQPVKSRDEPQGPVTMADVFGAICVMQMYVDWEGSFTAGATREVIGFFVNEDDQLYNSAVLRALGREASITFSANRVYARHPKIAEAAVKWLRANNRFQAVCRMLGHAGGRLRAAGEDRSAYEGAFSTLASRLGEAGPAVAAAMGAIEGASGYLQPRITYLSVQRKYAPDLADVYARKIGKLIESAKDRDTAIRVLLNEMAVVALTSSAFRIAAGLAALSLHNGTGRGLQLDQASYAFGSLARAYKSLILERESAFIHGAQLLVVLSERLIPEHEKYVRRELPRVRQPEDLMRLSTRTLLDRLATELNQLAKNAIVEYELPFGAPKRDQKLFPLLGRVDFSDMEQLERR